MTDNEIIKAFEVCFSVEDCKGCPLCDEEDCPSSFQLVCMVLDLIDRQQAEIERLQNTINDTLDRQPILVERAEKYAKSEAIKEFADEFEYEIIHKEFWNEHTHTSQVWLNGYEQCMRDIRVMLKDKVKEMVGEE